MTDVHRPLIKSNTAQDQSWRNEVPETLAFYFRQTL